MLWKVACKTAKVSLSNASLHNFTMIFLARRQDSATRLSRAQVVKTALLFISTFHLLSATFVWEVKMQTNNKMLTTTTKLRTTLPENNSENSLPISYKHHPLLLSDWEMHTPNSLRSSYTHTSMSIHCRRQRQCFPKPWPISDSPAASMCMSSFGTGVTVIPSLRSTVRPSLSCMRTKQQISDFNRHVLCHFLQQRSDCRAFIHIMHIHPVQYTLSLTHSYHLCARWYIINLHSFWFYATLFKCAHPSEKAFLSGKKFQTHRKSQNGRIKGLHVRTWCDARKRDV